MSGHGMGAKSRWAAVVIALIATQLSVHAPASGQEIGVGYITNAPDMLLGGGAYVILPVAGGIGLYGDWKTDIDPPTNRSNFVNDLTAAEAEALGHSFFNSRDSWRSFNAALIRPVSASLLVYAGAGYSKRTRYVEYNDPDFQFGTAGWYWVVDEEGSAEGVNLLAGILTPLAGAVHAHIGFETAPRGVTVGLSYLLDLR